MKKFRAYVYGRPVTVVSDHHALCWLMTAKELNGRLARWALQLQEFDVIVKYKAGRIHNDADALSRYPVDENKVPAKICAVEERNIHGQQLRDVTLHRFIDLAERGDAKFKVRNNILWRKNFAASGDEWLLVVPKPLRKDILEAAHTSKEGGHLGFAKVYHALQCRYFWPGMFRDVLQWIKTCHDCQRSKPGSVQYGKLQNMEIPSKPFHKIGIDLVSFNGTKSGNRVVVTVVDYLTKFIVAAALPNGSAEEVAKFLVEKVILIHGAPRIIISDRGQTFLSKLIADICRICGVDHRKTTSYHPQTNGLTERSHRTLEKMLAAYINAHQDNWDEILPFSIFAYNTKPQLSSRFSPFYLVHGREAETTIDAMMPKNNQDAVRNLEEYAAQVTRNADEGRRIAKRFSEDAQDVNKSRYDDTHQTAPFEVDDWVMVYYPIRKVGLSDKLMKRYFGPYRIKKRVSEVTFEVEPLDEYDDRTQNQIDGRSRKLLMWDA
jgi:hypothetical protein